MSLIDENQHPEYHAVEDTKNAYLIHGINRFKKNALDIRITVHSTTVS